MRILVVGMGSIGQRHYKNLCILFPKSEIAILRSRKKNHHTSAVYPSAVHTFFSASDALAWKPHATIIANPASLHIATALPFARQGSHLFIEKPLSINYRGVDALLQICRARGLVLMVGYMFRFFEPLRIVRDAILSKKIGNILAIRATVGQYLPDWRPEHDYRTSVSAKKELGGGAIFELSHELDYVGWLMGEVHSVHAMTGHVSDLPINVEDIAEIILRFHNGTIGNVHCDMIDRASNRSCRIIGSAGTIVWNANDGDSVRLYRASTSLWETLRSKKKINRNKMYMEELRHFFQCIKKKQRPLIGGEDGKRVLAIALAMKRSATLGRTISL